MDARCTCVRKLAKITRTRVTTMSQWTRREREFANERRMVRAQVNTQARSFSSGREEGEERRLRGDRVLSERREADESERARALIKKVAH